MTTTDLYATDRPATDLGRAIRVAGGFALYRAPWQTVGLSIWIRYTEGETGEARAMLARDDLPETARDDFAVYVDEIEEELRVDAHTL